MRLCSCGLVSIGTVQAFKRPTMYISRFGYRDPVTSDRQRIGHATPHTARQPEPDAHRIRTKSTGALDRAAVIRVACYPEQPTFDGSNAFR